MRRLLHQTLILVLFLVFIRTAAAQQDYFQTGYGGSGTEKFNDIEPVPSGGFLAIGYTNSFGAGGYDVLLMRTNANGDQLWTKTAGSSGDEFANCMTVLNDGTTIIAGSTSGFTSPGASEAFAMRIDSSGNVMWFETFKDSIANFFYDVTVRADNSILLAGQSHYTQSWTVDCSSIVVIDANGAVLSSKKFTIPGTQSRTNAVVALPGGSVITAGQSDGGLDLNASLMRITPGGTVGWSKAVSPSGGDDLFCDVCYAGGKRCAAVGATNTFGAGGYDVLFTLFDTTGIHKKTRSYGTPQTDYGYSIVPCSDGGFAITGITEDAWAAGQFDPFILRIDSLGNQMWIKVLGTPYPDVFSAMMNAGNGNFIVCGSSEGLGQVTNAAAYIALTDTSGQSDCNSIPFQFQTDSLTTYSNATATFIVEGYLLNFRTISSQVVPAIETYPLCPTGIADIEQGATINIYPQPAATQLVISAIPSDANEMQIYNSEGQIVFTQSISQDDNSFILDVVAWNSGLYFVALRNETGTMLTRKFIISSQ